MCGRKTRAIPNGEVDTAKYLRDRDDVSDIRFTRTQPNDYGMSNRDFLQAVDSISPGGTVFHVLTDTPDDIGDLLTIAIDGATVVRFELPRSNFEGERKVGGPPCDVDIEAFSDFRHRSGQRLHRRLDLIAADARRVLSQYQH